jgi:predicted RNA-binding protein with PIN domain
VTQVLIDGHNVMFAWEGVRQAGLRDPRAGRQRVVEAASRYQAQRPGRKVVVVFDGREGMPGSAEGRPGVRVIYSRPPMNADMVIREMVEKALGISPNPSFPKREREEVWVVSSDREVQSHAKSCGAKVFGAKAFEAEMLGRVRPLDGLTVRPLKGSKASHLPSPGRSEKPTRMRKMDVDFWLKVMQEKREA